MKYSKVNIASFGYELPPNVVSSEDLEKRLAPLYKALHFQKGQLESLTGIRERRFWDPGFRMAEGAILAGEKAISAAGIDSQSIQMLVYGGVCRDNLEPATACAVSNGLGLGPDTLLYDVSNACLGILNGLVQVANAIELGQISAGLVVSCESAREIVDSTIQRMLTAGSMDVFKHTVATLTGGSGAVAVLLTDASLSDQNHRLLGGAYQCATQHHKLCTWGPDSGISNVGEQVMNTDSVGVLKHGVVLGIETYREFRKNLSLTEEQPDKTVCHQVGSTHQDTILKAIGIPRQRDFATFQYLGNIGTVSLPITAAIAAERDFFKTGDLIGMLGIGSGLNCLILGIVW
jgi:3-oxoacyl-[acyl-carrier-protein] synthase-3